eukprot:01002.XXX_3501_3665_1 [CDS] Oithona nana genome sequencing.
MSGIIREESIRITAIAKSRKMQRSQKIKDFWGVVVECKVMPRVYRKTLRFKTQY